jgi:hypothetical protein
MKSDNSNNNNNNNNNNNINKNNDNINVMMMGMANMGGRQFVVNEGTRKFLFLSSFTLIISISFVAAHEEFGITINVRPI